jgi:glutamate racemase
MPILIIWYCSHPYLIPQIKEILPNHIQIIDSGEAVETNPESFTRKVGFNRKKNSTPIFYTNANPKY